jgi:hypothetical protein
MKNMSPILLREIEERVGPEPLRQLKASKLAGRERVQTTGDAA